MEKVGSLCIGKWPGNNFLIQRKHSLFELAFIIYLLYEADTMEKKKEKKKRIRLALSK